MKSFHYILTIILFLSIFLISCSKNKVETIDVNKTESKIDVKNISFITSDSLNIKGDYYFNISRKEIKEPLVILIHQFRSNRKQWDKTLIDSLINIGCKVLTYDIRNHGESGKSNVNLGDILTNPNLAPKDLEAIFKWLKLQTSIDSERIAVIGTSIGASLSLYAKFYLGAKTIVGISGGRETFEGLTGINDKSMSMVQKKVSSVLFICGSKDYDYAKEEEFIMNYFIDFPKETKIFESEKHGKDLITQYPEINKLISDWLKKYL